VHHVGAHELFTSITRYSIQNRAVKQLKFSTGHTYARVLGTITGHVQSAVYTGQLDSKCSVGEGAVELILLAVHEVDGWGDMLTYLDPACFARVDESVGKEHSCNIGVHVQLSSQARNRCFYHLYPIDRLSFLWGKNLPRDRNDLND
jgi:hypothetical protein